MPSRKDKQVIAIRELFQRHGGVMRTRDARCLGIHPQTLYRMCKAGDIEQLGRGLYCLPGLPGLGRPDLALVSLKIPRGVICLISALALHNLTTQVPHRVYVALPRGAEPPRLPWPPVRIFWFSEPAFSAGVEVHKCDGFPLRTYSPEKTIADCFKYRNKIGLDVAIEALKLYCERRRVRTDDLLHYAAICRVEKIIRPYLEALL